jgi:nitronate monooxygenase
LVREIRTWFDGPLALSGAIATGEALLAARALGADFGYMGSPFIATNEANAQDAYKAMIVQGGAEDIVTSSLFTGVSGNYLKSSIKGAGMDPDNLETADSTSMNFSSGSSKPKAWKEVWGAGQGIGSVQEVTDVATLIGRIEREYKVAGAKLALEMKSHNP